MGVAGMEETGVTVGMEGGIKPIGRKQTLEG
jgi:hypothetical protein